MSFRSLPFALAALLITGCERPEEKPSAVAAAEGFPALYTIKNGQGETEGWLFGTVHALPSDVPWRSPGFDAIVAEADSLVVEVANLDDSRALARAWSEFAYDSPPPEPVRERLELRYRAAFDALTSGRSLPSADIDGLESWAAALTLAQYARSGDAESGADQVLLAAFREREIIELEGTRAQLAKFDALPEEEQRDLLEAVIEEAEFARENPSALAIAWKTGDLEQIEAASQRGILADPELRDALLVERNSQWANQLFRLLEDQPRPLIAVGAAHLIGDKGLPALLQTAGYEVVRIQ